MERGMRGAGEWARKKLKKPVDGNWKTSNLAVFFETRTERPKGQEGSALRIFVP
jgi:hypothetical protein